MLRWTIEKLSRQDACIRARGETKTNSFIDGVSFRYSKAYIEKPINILLKRGAYLELAELSGIIEVTE